jgi:hypothetical protein
MLGALNACTLLIWLAPFSNCKFTFRLRFLANPTSPPKHAFFAFTIGFPLIQHVVCVIKGWFVLVADAARPDIVRNTAAAQSLPHISLQKAVSKRIFGKPLAASGASIRRALFLQSPNTRFAKRVFCIFPLPRTKLVFESDAQARPGASFLLEYVCPPRLSNRCPPRAMISATMPVPLAHLL